MSDQDKKTFFIIDGYAQIFRAYYAIRNLSSTVTGEPTNATFGFMGMLIKLWKDYKPDYVAIALDVGGDQGTFRSQLDPEYKAHRDPPPADLKPQANKIMEIAAMMGIPVIGVEGFEADDIIASLCVQENRDDLNFHIVSKDKDLEQCLRDNVVLCDVHKDTQTDVAGLMEKKQVRPDQVVDLLALMGDNADNIPGAKGVGPKTASKLIARYGSIDGLYEHVDELKGKQKENVIAAEERVRFNIDMVKLREDVEMDFKLEDAAAKPFDLQVLEPVFKELGFHRHLSDIAAMQKTQVKHAKSEVKEVDTDSPAGTLFDMAGDDSEEISSSFETIDKDLYTAINTEDALDELIEKIKAHAKKGGELCFDTETTSSNAMWAKLCGVSLAIEEKQAYYIPVRSPEPSEHLDEATVVAKLKPIFEDASIKKIAQNMKYDVNVLRGCGIKVQGVAFDTMIASYLIDSSRNSHSMDNLALAYLNYEPMSITKLIGKGKRQLTFDKVPAADAVPYAGEDADVTLRLKNVLEPLLEKKELRKLFDDLEMPIVEVLAELEANGILVDPEELDRQKQALADRLAQLKEDIYEAAGGEIFNIDSTKQLADVLFNQLGCKVIRRGKTGPSTNAEVLDRIANEQDPPGSIVAGLVIEYRELTKLMNTYMDSLKDAIHPTTGRIHASFNQTVAATGRLSSSDPNLQNIPIRRESGRMIRKAFIAPEDHLLVAADYSQVELRMLAHLSGDEGLIEAFEQGHDIHQAVAAQVFDTPLEEVDSEQRSAAKMVNFGIVYGITPYGLARRLGTSAEAGSNVELAKQIIDDYKRRYPRITEFLNTCVAEAQRDTGVHTICGRFRPIPQIHSRNGNERQLGERMAINTVVQGSAADLIKLAMLKLHRQIHDEKLPMKMLLQIHDELVFEVPKAEVPAMSELIREGMMNAMALKVPVKVDVSTGENWMESK